MPRKFTWAETALMELVRGVATIYPIGLGVAILASGNNRFNAVSWDTLMGWASPEVWGWAIIGFGLLTVAQHFWASLVGYAGLAAWFWFWTSSFVVNLLHQPDSSLTGIPTYGGIAIAFTGFAVATWMDRDDA